MLRTNMRGDWERYSVSPQRRVVRAKRWPTRKIVLVVMGVLTVAILVVNTVLAFMGLMPLSTEAMALISAFGVVDVGVLCANTSDHKSANEHNIDIIEED